VCVDHLEVGRERERRRDGGGERGMIIGERVTITTKVTHVQNTLLRGI